MEMEDFKWVGAPGEVELRQLVESGSCKPLKDKKKVVRYIRFGSTIAWTLHVPFDVLEPDVMIGSESILSDGEWAWHKSFAYYIKKYDVPIHDEFLQKVRRNRYRIGIRNRLKLLFNR